MSIELPVTAGKWKVAHGRDGFADVISSRALDFSKMGDMALSAPPIALYTTNDDADFLNTQAIVADENLYYIITTGNVFLLAPGTGAITEATTTGMPNLTVATDGVPFAGEILISADNTVYSFNATTWTSRITSLTPSIPHPLCVFENRNTLCVGDGNVVRQYSTGYSEDTTNKLTIPSQYTITWMRWKQNVLFIGTRNITGGQAKIFIWNGSGSSAQQGYGIACDWAYSAADYLSSIAVLTSAGQILRFNGGGFDEITHFPVYETPYSWSTNAAISSTNGKCPNRGMVAQGDRLYMMIDGSIQTGTEGYPGHYLHNQPSGLWMYDPDVGLSHRSGVSCDRYNTLTVTSVSDNTINFLSVAHDSQTGDEVRASSVANITGLTTGRDYFVIKVSETSFKLAFSPADALAGRYITISGTPSGDTIQTNSMVLGSVANITPGAIAPFTKTVTQRFLGSELFFTARSADANNIQTYSLMSFGTGRNVGHAITSKIHASAIQDAFNKLIVNLEKLYLDTDLVRLKIRNVDVFGLPTPERYSDTGLATWVTNQQFTINTLTKDFRSASVGDEIDIVEGAGAGYTAHITAIDDSSTTYVVDIDEVIPNVILGNTSEVVVDNWKKMSTDITVEDENLTKGFAQRSPDSTRSEWSQFKVEYRGRSIPVNKIAVITAVDKEYPN